MFVDLIVLNWHQDSATPVLGLPFPNKYFFSVKPQCEFQPCFKNLFIYQSLKGENPTYFSVSHFGYSQSKGRRNPSQENFGLLFDVEMSDSQIFFLLLIFFPPFISANLPLLGLCCCLWKGASCHGNPHLRGMLHTFPAGFPGHQGGFGACKHIQV